MKTLKFKCTLLSDVILNQNSATEGATKTLDFIPGSNFLGIVASQLYTQDNDEHYQLEMLELFHSGKVRFGDAHLANGQLRSVKVPAALYYPKLKQTDDFYVHHEIVNPTDPELRKLQLKQCRSGFYTFEQGVARRCYADTTSFIKSAFDRERRCSKDEQLYVYESLKEGVSMLFTVEIDDDSIYNSPDKLQQLEKALCGKKRIGRSRTAQFGLVEIERLEDFNEPQSCSEGSMISINGQQETCVSVYADGRLIFLDKYGLPTYQPTAEMLGLPADAEVIWSKSQIRTFQYSPWNYKRQCFDADRCGIEKGSVIVVKCNASPAETTYVGSYKNEGFGRVIYNPNFLKADATGKTLFSFVNAEDREIIADSKGYIDLLQSDNNLLNYLGNQMENEVVELHICQRVNQWVKDYRKKFGGENFASQWGTIRGLAILYDNEDDLLLHLYGERKGEYIRYTENEAKLIGYLTHGVASQKWEESGRLNLLKDFCEEFQNHLQKALINLSSEMAKQSSPKKKGVK